MKLQKSGTRGIVRDYAVNEIRDGWLKIFREYPRELRVLARDLYLRRDFWTEDMFHHRVRGPFKASIKELRYIYVEMERLRRYGP